MAVLNTLFFFLGVVVVSVSGEDCVWNKDKDYPAISPLIFDSFFKLVLPALESGSRIVRVASGSALTLACPGSTLKRLKTEAVKATCSGGMLLTIEGNEYPLSALSCRKKVKETIRRDVGSCGSESVRGIFDVIGFEVATTNRFYELIRICYDANEETNLYSKHVIHGKNIEAKDIDPKRPSFKTSSGFFNISMSTSYSKRSQLALMEDLLGSKALAKQMIDSRKQYYFAKGHMAPDADFVTEAEQDATYYYINAVPQWQAFNNGNWKYLEFATRDLAEKRSTDMTIYSGSWGVLELDDINGNPVDIYLGLSAKERVVPAPALNWKVIYEESSESAVAVVGINNPHISTPPEPLCKNICSDLPWIDFKTEDLGHGYTYCCDVNDLRKFIPIIPDLGKVHLLGHSSVELPSCRLYGI